ncbi:MAG: DUF1800 domain-containing protein [Thiolinea sp.]
MSKLGFIKARHLLARTGFGAEWEEVQRFQAFTLDQAVAFLMKNKDMSLPPVPNFSNWQKMSMLNRNMARRKMVMRIAKTEKRGLQAWWLQHMLTTRSPFLERMTLFWHNHFPSSVQKTKMASLLVNQNRLLRKHALGNYGLMLREIAKDPAMLVYLDGYQNRKGALNENFSRELLEIFTIGRGRYSERDVKEAARAFTGWTINHRGQFAFDRTQHDAGVKTFLGQRGRFHGDDIITILLKNPHTAKRLAEKLWHEFISVSRPHPAVIAQWSNILIRSNYNMSIMMQVILKSPQFWDPRNRGNLIKSPIELAIGTLRSLPYSLPRNDLAHSLNNLGQGVFEHPNVKGWSGGHEWVSTHSLLRRTALLANLTRGNLNTRRRKSGVELRLPKVSNDQLRNWLLAIEPVKPIAHNMDSRQRYVRELVLDPAYQVT